MKMVGVDNDRATRRRTLGRAAATMVCICSAAAYSFGNLNRMLGILLPKQISVDARSSSSPSDGNNDLPQRDFTNNKLERATRFATRVRRIDKSALPWSCGLIFFYHVGATGGTTLNDWLLEYSKDRNGTSNYFTFWGKDDVQERFVRGMDDLVQNISSDEWRISQAHHNSLYLNESDRLMDGWRAEVESQGCHFVGCIMFRDPLSHMLSKHRYQSKEMSREDFIDHLRNQTGNGIFETQLDYVLYNRMARNPYNASADVKVERALDILAQHFDVVSVGSHGDFTNTIRQITGWPERMMKRANSGGSPVFDKKELENFQKLLGINGDLDFIDAVRLIYGI